MIKVKAKIMIKVKVEVKTPFGRMVEVEVKVEDFLCMIHHQIIFLA